MKRAAEHAWNQRWEQALTDYEAAAEEFPEDLAARGNLALTHYRLGNWQPALHHYRWMLEQAPDNTFIVERLIEVYHKLELADEVLALREQLEAMKHRPTPQTSDLTVNLPPGVTGSLTLPTIRTGQLVRRSEGLLTSDLKTLEIDEMLTLAMAYEENGRIREAIRHYELAIKAGLDRADALYSLGLLYQQHERHEDALNVFNRCLDDPDYAMSAAYATGISQRALGQGVEGAQMLELAISLIDHEQIGVGELDELIVIYQTTIEALKEIGALHKAGELAASLADFIVDRRGSQEQAETFRQRGRELMGNQTGVLPSTPPTPVSYEMVEMPTVDPFGVGQGTIPLAGTGALPIANDLHQHPATTGALPTATDDWPRPATTGPLPADGDHQPPVLTGALPTIADDRPQPAGTGTLPIAGPSISGGHGAPANVAASASNLFGEMAPTQPIIPARPGDHSGEMAPTQPFIPAEPRGQAGDEAHGPTIAAVVPNLSTAELVNGPDPSQEATISPLGEGNRTPVVEADGARTDYRRLRGRVSDHLPSGSNEPATLASAAAMTRPPGTRSLGSRPTTVIGGGATSTLSGSATSLIGAKGSPRLLRALSGPLPGLADQAPEVQALVSEGEADARAGRPYAAIDAIRAALQLAPSYFPLYLRLAELHARRGESAYAIDLVQTTSRLLAYREESLAERLPLLRFLLRLRPADESVLTAFTEAVHSRGVTLSDVPIIRRHIRRLLERGSGSRALAEADRLVEGLPGNLEALQYHGAILAILGQGDRSLTVFRSILKREPGHIGAIAGANVAFALQNEDEHWWSSLEALVKAARAKPNRLPWPLFIYRLLLKSSAAPRIQLTVGLLYLTIGQPLTAWSWVEPLLKESRTDRRLQAIASHIMAEVAAAMNQPATERAQRQATLTLLSDNKVARQVVGYQLFDHPLTPSHLGLQLANALIAEGEIGAAVQSLEGLRRAAPGDEAILNRLAELHVQTGRLGAALAALDELASHYRDTGRLTEMAAVLDRMSRLAPDNIKVKTRLIDAYLQRGFVAQARYELEARATLEAAANQIDDAVQSLQQAAQMAWTLNEPEAAFLLCERMISTQPENTDLRQFLITLLLQAGQNDRAVTQIWELANSFISAANHRDAIASLHQIIGLAPEDAKAHHRLGEALAAVGEYAQAERVYRRLVRQHPDDAVARAKMLAMAALMPDSEHAA